MQQLGDRKMKGRPTHCGRPCVGSRCSFLQDRYVSSVQLKAGGYNPAHISWKSQYLNQIRIRTRGALGPSPEIAEAR